MGELGSKEKTTALFGWGQETYILDWTDISWNREYSLVLTFTPNRWDCFTTHIRTSQTAFADGHYFHRLDEAIKDYKNRGGIL